MKTLRWIYWKCYYAVRFRFRPLSLNEVPTVFTRCCPPWWKFEPSVKFEDLTSDWDITLEQASHYCHYPHCQINCGLDIDSETGRVVGILVSEAELRRAAQTLLNREKVTS